jgi:transcriptional regulator with XRE-family HTH domain
MSLGENVKRIRKSKCLSILDIKELTGLSKSTISELENDKSSPTSNTLTKIAKALNVSIDDFFKTEIIQDNEIDKLDKDLKDLSPKLAKLSPSERKRILTIIDLMLQENDIEL